MMIKKIAWILMLVVLLIACFTACTETPKETESVSLPTASVPAPDNFKNSTEPSQTEEKTDAHAATDTTEILVTQVVIQTSAEDEQTPIQTLEVEKEVIVTYNSGIEIGGN